MYTSAADQTPASFNEQAPPERSLGWVALNLPLSPQRGQNFLCSSLLEQEIKISGSYFRVE